MNIFGGYSSYSSQPNQLKFGKDKKSKKEVKFHSRTGSPKASSRDTQKRAQVRYPKSSLELQQQTLEDAQDLFSRDKSKESRELHSWAISEYFKR